MSGVYAIVLCGGESKRMKQSKALLEVGGVPLLSRVCKAVSEVADDCVVVAAKGQVLPALPAVCRRVDDDLKSAGPLAGLSTGIRALGKSDGHTFVVGCDYPFLSAPFLSALLDCAGESDVTVFAAEGAQPLCAWYRTACLLKAPDLVEGGVFRLSQILDGLSVKSVAAAELAPSDPVVATFSLNTPEEHDRAEEMARSDLDAESRQSTQGAGMKTEDKSIVTEEEILAVVDRLEGWSYDAAQRVLVRQWQFEKYVPTMAFIRKLTEVMDQENHHSDLALDGRSKTLTVKVTTFSEGRVTRADLEFAEVVSGLSL